jgi:hypothetical protein
MGYLAGSIIAFIVIIILYILSKRRIFIWNFLKTPGYFL